MRRDLARFLDTLTAAGMVKVLSWLVGVACAGLLGAYFAYFGAFHGGFSSKQETWGHFGDFIGGTVNPILSFLSLLALVFTVILQTRQLENSREELENSKLELAASREEAKRALETQARMAEAATLQAHHASLTARLSALEAALSVTNELLDQMPANLAVLGLAEHHSALVRRKERVANEILLLTDTLLERKA